MKHTIQLESGTVFEKDGHLFIMCKAIDERIPENLRPYAAERLKNLPLFWRHQTPQKDKFAHQPVYGRVPVAEGYSKGVMAIAMIYGASAMPYVNAKRRALVQLVKRSYFSKTPIGLSLTYDCIKVNGKVVEVEPLELSITPWPACKTCVI